MYYAGHGIEVNRRNWLVPVDAKLAHKSNVEDEAISLDRITALLDPAGHLQLVILDACRHNPLAQTMKPGLGRTRSSGGGLAAVEPSGDTLIAFAARAGSTAEDGRGANSPFTTALLKYLAEPGLDVGMAFRRIRDDVLKGTGNRQEPFLYGSLGGKDIPLVRKVEVVSTPPEVVDPAAEARRDFEFARRIDSRKAWETFLTRHPTGFHADLARSQLDELTAADRGERARIEREQAERAQREALEQLARERLEQDRMDRERLAREQAERETAQRAEDAKREDERRRLARDAAEKEKIPGVAVVAALPPKPETSPPPAAKTPELSGDALVLEIKKELSRVGCHAGRIDGTWARDAEASARRFATYAKLTAVPGEPTIDFLDAIRGRSARICPLECGTHEIEKNGRCVRKACGKGLIAGADGTCIRREVPVKTSSRSPERKEAATERKELRPERKEPRAAVKQRNPGGPRVIQGTKTPCLNRGGRTGGDHTFNRMYGACS